MNQEREFEVMAFEITPQFEAESDEGEYEGEGEYAGEFESGGRSAPRPAARRYVTKLHGPAAECARAMRRAVKTPGQALAIINAQIEVAIKMLRKTAADLERASAAQRRRDRTQATKDLFLKIFRVRPGFVPKDWPKPTGRIKDRGDVVKVRCARVADLLASGQLKFFCAINGTNCPDCASPTAPNAIACSSYGKDRVVCLGDKFWDAMKAGDSATLLAVLMHEPFHIYFGEYVTEHRANSGKFGGIYCIVQFVFDANKRREPPWMDAVCANTKVRSELETSWA